MCNICVIDTTQVQKPVDAHKKSTKGVYFVPHAYLENTTACHVWNTSKSFLADCIWTQLANLLLSSFFFNSCCLLFFSFPFFFSPFCDKMFPKALIAQEGVTGDMVYEKAKSTTASLQK